jgi:diacylglycerol kinase
MEQQTNTTEKVSVEQMRLGNKDFSLLKRAESLTHAWRGLVIFFKGTHNAWIHVTSLVVVVVLGFYFHVSNIEWMILALTCGFVLSAEAFNTAIEIDMDLTSPSYHPYARDTKDVAAGAVLLSALASVVVGLLIFGPRILALF